VDVVHQILIVLLLQLRSMGAMVHTRLRNVTYRVTGYENATCNITAGTCECPPIPGWTCDPCFYNDSLSCNCNCGLYDPDCDDPHLRVEGCSDIAVGLAICLRDGRCAERPAPPTRLLTGFTTFTSQCGRPLEIKQAPDTDYPTNAREISVYVLDSDWNFVGSRSSQV
jgi:hypothetical protein